MWAFLAVTYVLGSALTAAVVLRNQSGGRNNAFNAAVIALWPMYWIWFLISLVLNRAR